MIKRAIAILFLAGVAYAGVYPGQDSMVIVKSSSNFTTNGTGLATIPNLDVDLQAGTTYQFDFYILFQTTTTTTGARFASTFSATPAVIAYNVHIPIAAADGTDCFFDGRGTASADASIGTGVNAANTTYVTHIEGIVVTGAASTMSQQIGSELAGSNALAMANSLGIVTVIL